MDFSCVGGHSSNVDCVGQTAVASVARWNHVLKKRERYPRLSGLNGSESEDRKQRKVCEASGGLAKLGGFRRGFRSSAVVEHLAEVRGQTRQRVRFHRNELHQSSLRFSTDGE